MLCKHEVVGSIPSASTNDADGMAVIQKEKTNPALPVSGTCFCVLFDIVKRNIEYILEMFEVARFEYLIDWECSHRHVDVPG